MLYCKAFGLGVEATSTSDPCLGASYCIEVKPVAWLTKGNILSLFTDKIWNTLSFTRTHDRKASERKRIFLGSKFREMESEDGSLLEKIIVDQ